MKRLFKLNTYFKFLLLIASTSVFFFILYTSLYLYTIQEEDHFYKTTYNQYHNEVKSLFRLNSKTPTAAVIDVTFWDELVNFTKTKDEIATVHKYYGWSYYTIITDRKIYSLKKGTFLNVHVSNLKKVNVLLVELL